MTIGDQKSICSLIFHLLVGEAEVVSDLVDDRLAHFLDDLLVRPAHCLDVLLIDHHDLRELEGGHGRLLELADTLVQPQNVSPKFPGDLAGRPGLDQHGNVLEALGELGGEIVQRPSDQTFKLRSTHAETAGEPVLPGEMLPDQGLCPRRDGVPLDALVPRDRDEVVQKEHLTHTRDRQQITGQRGRRGARVREGLAPPLGHPPVEDKLQGVYVRGGLHSQLKRIRHAYRPPVPSAG